MNAIVLTDRLEAAPIDQSKPILSIEDLNVRFGSVVAIESLSLTVRRGEFVSLLGPSGCGKSTLLKAIARLVKPTGGRIVRPYADLRTGFMFQKPLLLPWRTTLDNVLLPVEIQRGGSAVDPAERRNALRMLDLVRLGDFAQAYPHQLSGGMQQRAALARALMCDPDVLLLDEPFGALDELTRDVLNEELIRIWQSKETRLSTVLMVTHSIPEAVTMSDRVIVLSSRPARLVEDVAVPCRAAARARRRRDRRDHPPHPRHGEERPMMSRAVAPLAFGLLLLVAWQAIVMVGHIPEYLLPAPTAILATVDRSLAGAVRGDVHRGACRLPHCQRRSPSPSPPCSCDFTRSRKACFPSPSR